MCPWIKTIVIKTIVSILTTDLGQAQKKLLTFLSCVWYESSSMKGRVTRVAYIIPLAAPDMNTTMMLFVKAAAAVLTQFSRIPNM